MGREEEKNFSRKGRKDAKGEREERDFQTGFTR
jgi:hypothetical protein